MIGLTRTGGEHCLLDPADIQRIEAHPTTVVHLTDGARYCVEETIDQIVGRVRASRAAGRWHPVHLVRLRDPQEV